MSVTFLRGVGWGVVQNRYVTLPFIAGLIELVPVCWPELLVAKAKYSLGLVEGGVAE